MQKQLIFTALEYTRSVLGVLFQCPKVSPFSCIETQQKLLILPLSQ